MALLVDGSDVRAVADVAATVRAIEQAFLQEQAGNVIMPSRINLDIPGNGFFRLMPAVLLGTGVMGFKVFHGGRATGVRYLIAIYDVETCELLALIDGNYLTGLRTGATTAVATKWLARPEASAVAVVGSGLEARTNLAGVCAVRDIQAVRVYSPNGSNCAAFADEMTRLLDVPVKPMQSAQDCVDGADIVVVATNTSRRGNEIAFQGAWIQPGMHINAIGSTQPTLRELDPAAFEIADLIVVDAADQALVESGDVIAALEAGTYPSDKVVQLSEILGCEQPPGSTSRERPTTLFKSIGTAIQDVAAGYCIYEAASSCGIGRVIEDFFDVKYI